MSQLWQPTDPAMPALYLGHGAPPLLEDRLWMAELAAWSAALPRPRAILIVSAHWESAPVSLTSTNPDTPLVYDFSGFDPKYNRMTYRTPAATELARQVKAVMPANEPVHEHSRRGLDHGAWVPLRVMYPAADIPVLQMSLPSHDPERLLELGRRLAPLRDEGVLIIGSGFLTHGLPFLKMEHFQNLGSPPGWSRDFDAWAADALTRGDVDALANYATKAPGMPYAHPTPEHYSPLFVTLGAATDPTAAPQTVIDGFGFGLSKRSIQVA